MKTLSGKVAVVTGGASGIGYALADALLREGMRVAVLDVEEPALAAASERLKALSPDVLTLHADVTDRPELTAAADEVERRFGRIDVACNNAGVGCPGPADQLSFDDWDWVMSVNLDGVFNGCRIFADHIKRHGEGGHIVNTGSLGAYLTGPSGAYPASKAAVVALSESFRQALEPHGIGVSVLCPGLVRTAIFRARRNRPARYADTDLDRQRRMETRGGSLLDNAMDPQVVAAAAVEAIRANRLYVFPEASLQSQVSAKFDGILASFDRTDA